jgi:WD40 repeat protein
MARLFDSPSALVAELCLAFLALSSAIIPVNAEVPQALFDYPTLVADPGLHTGVIRSAAVDNAGRLAVTGAEDKTVRIWTLDDGKLWQVIRMPAGPGYVGKVFAVAMDPKGDFIAIGGWTRGIKGEESIYLFNLFGTLVRRIGGLAEVVNKLVFSPDGRYLAAALGDRSLRIYDRDNQWAEVFCDPKYQDGIYGITFASDGRLATASYDMNIRLYDAGFNLITKRIVREEKHPYQIAFNHDGSILAVGYADAAIVDFLDGATLDSKMGPNTEGIAAPLSHVAWSGDGKTLFAGSRDVVAWGDAGHGQPRVLPGGKDTLMSLNPLPDGDVMLATADPLLKRLKSDGSVRWGLGTGMAGLGNQSGILAVSNDGTIVDFGFGDGVKARFRFDVGKAALIADPSSDESTALPKRDGLPVERRGDELFLDGKLVQLDKYEKTRVLAIHPDGNRFVVGTTRALRARKADNKPLWRRDGPGALWAVNIAGNGRLVVAAYDDGTIRWHAMDSGRELLALMVLPNAAADKNDWVAWTPEGFYASKGAGAFGVLQWHVNHSVDAAGRTVRASDVPGLRRPEALAAALQEGGLGKMGIAEAERAREAVRKATGSIKAPGARLHVLAIGVSKYGDLAKALELKFAHKDAEALTAVLFETQDGYQRGGAFYAEVKPQPPLIDGAATKTKIYEQLATMRLVMNKDDTAVVLFSGHGMTIGRKFYLMPYGVDATRPPASMQATAMLATEFKEQIEQLADQGRVLVLLDACRSGAFTDDSMTPNADVLGGAVASANINVLTSSKGTQLSREREGQGVFTKVILQALADRSIDTNADGLISMHELATYLEKKLPEASQGTQQLGQFLRFGDDLFVAGL